jgi:hypothetical protein
MRAKILIGIAALTTSGDQPIKVTGQTAVDVGNIFARGGSDGLILYALILAVLLQFLGLVIVSAQNARDRRHLIDGCHNQAVEFASASKEAAEALKDAATAIASSASADMTFKQNMAGTLERLEIALVRFESKRR